MAGLDLIKRMIAITARSASPCSYYQLEHAPGVKNAELNLNRVGVFIDLFTIRVDVTRGTAVSCTHEEDMGGCNWLIPGFCCLGTLRF